MNKEDFIIRAFKDKLNGDDDAVLGKWCFNKDLFVQNVHFKRSWLSLEQIAAKAALVNISDAITVNTVPKHALLGFSLPNLNKKEIKNLQKGFLKMVKKFHIKIIGKDMIQDDKIGIGITLISKVKKSVFRTGLKREHLLAFTNTLGRSLEGLKTLQNGGKFSRNHKSIKPKLCPKFFYEIALKISCAMDISDGLSKDLPCLLECNHLGVFMFKKLSKKELYNGEGYETLFGFDKKHKKELKKTAKRHRIKLNIFAKAVKGKYELKGREYHFQVLARAKT